MATKRCRKCNDDLDVSLFGRRSDLKDGLNYICKECDRNKSLTYHHDNKAKCNSRSTKRYAENRSVVLGKMKLQYQQNPISSAAKARVKRANNPKVYNAIACRSYRNNKPKILLRQRLKVEALDDQYVINYLKTYHNVRGVTIPEKVINLKRKQLKAFRYVKQENNKRKA